MVMAIEVSHALYLTDEVFKTMTVKNTVNHTSKFEVFHDIILDFHGPQPNEKTRKPNRHAGFQGITVLLRT